MSDRKRFIACALSAPFGMIAMPAEYRYILTRQWIGAGPCRAAYADAPVIFEPSVRKGRAA